ncbi:MlaD family protein [Desulfurivibrio alkaliphilus]|uniref:Mammalian cell entry related domain protein n=1 Tax=Desulfurivibrio alkaliphilus (strain DSM 19089 / UNIQEM U267 / AHT2) TaxID=589865 RepID=D6Z3S5_DESAT|nr:MlaD family protein [Desulfurivibrio alkaliphilus]ADH86200.1 Mammalian cell entry related domain protein [Desulfurivibrio alkaliphilus AHT 2]
MENRSYALAAGIFVLVLGTAMVLAIWWFAGERELAGEYILVTEGNIGNLNVGADVRFRGIAAGKVTDIRLDAEDPRQILVTIRIDDQLPVTRGTVAVLDTQGVTGVAYVQLEDDGSDPRPLVAEPGYPPRLPLKPSMLTRIAEAALEAMQGLELMSNNLAKFLSAENQVRFDEMVVQLTSAGESIDQGLEGLPATLEAMQELLGPDNQQRLAAVLENLEQLGGEALPAVDDLRTLLVSLDGMSARLETAASELGRELGQAGQRLQAETLPKIDRMLEDIGAGSRRLNYLLEELELNPELLLRGWAEPEPGPGESAR